MSCELERSVQSRNKPGYVTLLRSICSGDSVDVPEEPIFDALLSTYLLLHELNQFGEEVRQEYVRLLARRLQSIGYPNNDMAQVQDLVYEFRIALFFLAKGLVGISLPEVTDGQPDIVVSLQFASSNTTSRVAVECKNLRSRTRSSRDLARSIAKVIVEARHQHKARQDKYQGMLVFVDLPIEVKDKPNTFVWDAVAVALEQLRLEGIGVGDDIVEFGDANIVFTVSSQRNMWSCLTENAGNRPSLEFLNPVTLSTTPLTLYAPIAILHHLIYTRQGQPLNVGNSYLRTISCNDE